MRPGIFPISYSNSNNNPGEPVVEQIFFIILQLHSVQRKQKWSTTIAKDMTLKNLAVKILSEYQKKLVLRVP